MLTSIKTTSGSSSTARSTASRPLGAVATTSIPVLRLEQRP